MAYYQTVVIRELDTLEEIDTAVDMIERRPDSYTNRTAFMRGAHCALKAAAQKKLDALQRRYFAIADQQEGE